MAHPQLAPATLPDRLLARWLLMTRTRAPLDLTHTTLTPTHHHRSQCLQLTRVRGLDFSTGRPMDWPKKW
jgi:hypothetical protein